VSVITLAQQVAGSLAKSAEGELLLKEATDATFLGLIGERKHRLR
jgi:hypothetical protein